ncbi:MAG: RNA polymerase sigma factor [Sedimentisphaerales bacterium]
MAENDNYFIEQCLDGRPDEFRHLVRRYQTAVTAYLTSKLGNKSNAEEAAQETFVRAYFNLSDLKKRDSFSSWLLGIAGRVVKEQLRNKIQLVDVELAEPRAKEQKTEDDFELQRAFAQLPDSHREILLLRFYASQSCQQIAANLNMPLGSVTKTLSRAYVELRRLLEKQKMKDNEVQR